MGGPTLHPDCVWNAHIPQPVSGIVTDLDIVGIAVDEPKAEFMPPALSKLISMLFGRPVDIELFVMQVALLCVHGMFVRLKLILDSTEQQHPQGNFRVAL